MPRRENAASDSILAALGCGRPGCPCAASARRGKGLTHCPAHDDRSPSLDVAEGTSKVLVKCHAACEQDAVVDALRERGLWASAPQRTGLALSELAAEKGLSEDFLVDLGVVDGVSGAKRRPCVDIPYVDAQGDERAVRKRLSLSGGRRFLWRRGDRVLPYGLQRLEPDQDCLLIVEGESDAWTCWNADIAALGIPGAATWKPEWAAYVEGIERIIVWREPGQGGNSFVKKIAASLPDVFVIEAPANIKDPSALWLATGCDTEVFQRRMRELTKSATPASALLAEEERKEAEEALAESNGLLDDPALLHRLVLASEAQGHVGDRENIAAIHMGLGTHRQRRLASIIIKGQSSTGKNDLLDACLTLWPHDLAIRRSAGSERWLLYSDEDFAHRFIVLAEANGLDESFGAYLFRTLLSEGRLIYEFPDKTADGLKGRVIEKEGPTGLIATTTRSSLDEELETRCWTIESNDSEEYLRLALRSIARRRNGAEADQPPEAERAALRYLGLVPYPGIVIRYGEWVAQQISVREPSMLRHFDRLLAAVEASAWLHHLQRGRDDQLHIVATVADYAHATAVMEKAFATATSSVTEKQRETWKALSVESEASAGEAGWVPGRVVAKRMKKSPGTVAKHLRALAKRGLAVQKEKGGPWKPDGTPGESSTLPTPYEIAAAFPDLWADWVHPVTGELHVCETPPETEATGATEATLESEEPSPTPSPLTQTGDTADRLNLGTGVARVATFAPNSESDAHTSASTNGGHLVAHALALGGERLGPCICCKQAVDETPAGRPACERHLPSMDPCYACKTTKQWARRDGGWVCARCHPAPSTEAVIEEFEIALVPA